jgi:transcriptional pleiotropic regulator of transition state genes
LKNTGIVRKIDELGRVVLPKEMREVFRIKVGNPLEFYYDEVAATIILIPYRPGCLICGEMEGLIEFRKKKVCKSCLEKLKLE